MRLVTIAFILTLSILPLVAAGPFGGMTTAAGGGALLELTATGSDGLVGPIDAALGHEQLFKVHATSAGRDIPNITIEVLEFGSTGAWEMIDPHTNITDPDGFAWFTISPEEVQDFTIKLWAHPSSYTGGETSILVHVYAPPGPDSADPDTHPLIILLVILGVGSFLFMITRYGLVWRRRNP